MQASQFGHLKYSSIVCREQWEFFWGDVNQLFKSYKGFKPQCEPQLIPQKHSND